MGMFYNEEEKKLEKKPEEPMPEEEQPSGVYLSEREVRLGKVMNAMQDRGKWDASGLKPNTRRKKIGLALLVIGLVSYLVLQYVVKG